MRAKDFVHAFLTFAALANPCLIASADESKPAEPAQSPRTPAPVDKSVREAVAHIVTALKKHPVPFSKSKEGRLLHLLDTETGEATLLADEPGPGLVYCGSPEWSLDGSQILFDATPAPGNVFHLCHLQLLQVEEEVPELTDLGPGNCPCLTPEGDRIVFLLNPGAVPNANAGIWIMQANGQQRRPLCDYGRPKVSPDGRQLLITSFSDPSEISLIDIKTAKLQQVRLPDRHIYTTPYWVGQDTLIATLGDNQGAADSIALVDISNPQQAKIKEILWKRGPELDVVPVYPIYSPASKRCFFIGRVRKGEAAASFYEIRPGQPGKPKKYDNKGYGVCLSDPIFSPDGRYIVFSAERILKPQE